MILVSQWRLRGVSAKWWRVFGRSPESAPLVTQRPGTRVVLVLRYPYKIFYRVIGETVRIVHIRHTVRRPWMAE
jgi:plasmid stabilization system protein ParE